MSILRLLFRGPRVWIALVSVGLLLSPALATTYYVAKTGSDGNPGTQSEPWLTIQKAADTMVAGDTAIVGPGTYDENGGSLGRVRTKASGSSGAYITFHASAACTTKGFYIDQDYIAVEGFFFRGFDTDWSAMVEIDGNRVQIRNNIFDAETDTNHHIIGIRFKCYGAPSSVGSPEYCVVSGNILRNFVYQAVEIWGVAHTLSANTFEVFFHDAIRVFGHGHVITGNTFDRIGGPEYTLTHVDVLQTFGDSGYECYDILFEKNVVKNSDCQVAMLSCVNVPSSHGMTFRNNVFSNVSLAVVIAAFPDVKVYSNTLYNCTRNTSHPVVASNNPATHGVGNNCQVYNNLFIGCGDLPDTWGSKGWYSFDATLAGCQADGNYVTGLASDGYPSKAHFSEPNGINGGDPGLVISGDLRLLPGSPAIDAGVALSGFNDDRDGNPRPRGAAWDIGAYEYLGAAPGPSPPSNLRIVF